MLMYLFIYLFGSLPVPSFHWLLPRVLLSCSVFLFFLLFFFPLLTWGPFGEGCNACWGEGTPVGQLLLSLLWGGGPCLLTGVGLGSVWEGALLTVHR